jgi:hypothetical protein
MAEPRIKGDRRTAAGAVSFRDQCRQWFIHAPAVVVGAGLARVLMARRAARIDPMQVLRTA